MWNCRGVREKHGQILPTNKCMTFIRMVCVLFKTKFVCAAVLLGFDAKQLTPDIDIIDVYKLKWNRFAKIYYCAYPYICYINNKNTSILFIPTFIHIEQWRHITTKNLARSEAGGRRGGEREQKSKQSNTKKHNN